jgi:hypothetical protein
MSAFNTVTAMATCPRCRLAVDVPVQFRYGNTWQYEYAIGDALRWGGNDVGIRGQAHVVIDAVADTPCPNCGYDDEWHLYVHVRNDRIASVETATGAYDFVKEGRGFIVVPA